MNAPRPLPRSPFVVRAAEHRAFADAYAIRQAAEAEASRIRSNAETEREAIHRAGFEAGVRQGREAAARLIATTEASLAAFWIAREAEMAALALAIAHRVVNVLPPGEIAAGIVAGALAEHRRDVPLTLRIPLAELGAWRDAVSTAGCGEQVAIEADARLAAGSATLVDPGGQTRVGLLDQFRALMDSVR